ncbi:MAG: DUF4271 domain-containing protein [Prevotella sp.]
MLQPDSIGQTGTPVSSGQFAKGGDTWHLTPAQVLKWLPKDATPAQQDSAIQAHFKPEPIHWSQTPDTLHLPGQPIGKSYRDVSLPQYYKESFFSKDSLFHPELSGGRIGVAGDPVPYNVASDNLISGLLLGCFVLALVAFSKTKQFVARQIKHFFYEPRSKTTTINETTQELRFQLFFVLQTCLLFSLVAFFYTHAYITNIFIIEPYEVIGIYAGIMVLYFILKSFAYWLVNWTFFDSNKNEQWMKSRLFLVSLEGVALFPIVMLLSYFEISIRTVVIYAAIVVILVKVLTLSKQYVIFFRKNGNFFQIILYFCALEIVPLVSLWGVFSLANSYLKVNF